MDISKIKSGFTGRVIGPDDSDYDTVRNVFPGDIRRKPAVIIRVADPRDIGQAISLAQKQSLALSVRCGGHSASGFGVNDGGVVIDVRDLKKTEVDKSHKTMWAGSGLTAREVTTKLDTDNLALGFGDTGSVGIGGITTGGGVGYLVRKFGLTIDNLMAADIVTADGKHLRIDDKTHPDLFWAIRGGGGNFGVVTRFQYKLHELDDVYGGMILLPATPETITGIIHIMEHAPNELSGIANIMPAPPMPMVPAEHHGKISIMALFVYAGNPDTGEKILTPVKKLAPPITDLTKSMRYKEIFFPDDESYHPYAVAKNFFMKSVNTKTAQTIIDGLNASDASMRVVQLRVLGGYAGEISEESTAYGHRRKNIMANVAAFYTGEDKLLRKKWVEDFSFKLAEGETGAYVGFLGPDEQTRIHEAYPGNIYDRLKKTKQIYDPDNIFRYNFNIV